MGLIVPNFSWGFGVSSLTGTPPAAVVGTNFTAGASNVDGTSVSVLSALAQDVHYLVVGVGGISLSAADSNALLDILIDPAGGTSWASFIDDLVCGSTPVPTTLVTVHTWYHFPIYIKAGSSVGVRCRTIHTANITTGRVIMHAYGRPSKPDRWWCGQKVETLGAVPASSRGTDVTPGNAADGSWRTIGTSTKRYGAVSLGVGHSDATAAAFSYYWFVGYGSTKLPAPAIFTTNSIAEMGVRQGMDILTNCNVPSGTIWQAMGRGNGAGEIHYLAIYGVY